LKRLVWKLPNGHSTTQWLSQSNGVDLEPSACGELGPAPRLPRLLEHFLGRLLEELGGRPLVHVEERIRVEASRDGSSCDLGNLRASGLGNYEGRTRWCSVRAMVEITRTQSSAEPMGSRLEFETLIADLSSQFINLSPGEVDGAIESALRRVCEFLAVDQAVLWQWSASDPETVVPTHAYPAQSALQHPEPFDQAQFPWVVQQMWAGSTVVLPTLDALPVEAAVDEKYARLAGIHSSLCLPLAVGGVPPLGALAFNTLKAPRDWPDVVVNRLQLVAQVFANALARRRADAALRESEERLSLAADSAGAGLWILDYATGAVWTTPRTRAIYGFGPDETVTLERLRARIHPNDRHLIQESVGRSARSGEPADVECRILVADGERWVSSRGRTRVAPSGEPARVMGVSIDITDRRREHQALLESQARLEAGAELAGLAFYEVDYEAGVMRSDERLHRLCGVPPDRLGGLHIVEFWEQHIHPDDRQRVAELRRHLHEGAMDQFSIEYRYLHPERGEIWIDHLAGPAARDAQGHVTRTYGVFHDVTDRRRAEEEARDLSRRLMRAQEEERALLARELHDDVSQRLAVLAIDVGRAELTADRAQAEALQVLREGLVELSDDIHSLAYQLHPSVLEELGLVEALRAECGHRLRRGQLEVSLDLHPLPPDLQEEAALCLFRVAQEALNNVARHAGTCTATVTLRQTGDGVLLAVSDDGDGFEPVKSGSGMHLGVASMRERVKLVRGSLDLESAPGQGTKVIAWVPVEAES
jgi:PAS domain S-box-containing protein